MELEKIRTKIEELASGNPDFPRQFGEMCIRDLTNFPRSAAEALKARDFRKLSQVNHQLKTIIGLFDLQELNRLIENPYALFESSDADKRKFLMAAKEETTRISVMIKRCIE